MKITYKPATLLNRKSKNQNPKCGFTLIELLVVVAIIAGLIAILLPAISVARETAKTTVCLTNLRQAGIVFQNYFNMYNDVIPPPTWWPQPSGVHSDYRIWPFLLRDAGLVKNGKGVNSSRPEPIAFRPGTYPEGIWRCPSGDAAIPYPDWSENKTHYGMSGNLLHVDPTNTPRNKWYWRVMQLPDPGKKVLLADSWHSGGNNQAIYINEIYNNPQNPYLSSALSIRHRDATNLLFFDGHAITKSRGPSDHIMVYWRFIYDFIKPDEWR